MSLIVVLLAAFFAVHSTSALLPKPIRGEFIVQLKGTAIPSLHKELGEALKARGMQSCTIKPQVAEIKTTTWAFVHCKEEAVSRTQGGVSATGVSSALRNTKNIAIEGIEPNMEGHMAALPDALWGVDEVDGRTNDRRCQRNSSLGHGVDVYIMDSGCNPTLGGICTSDIPDERNCTDLAGHGTHVGGTATGWKHGVAARARRHCVKVMSRVGGSSNAIILAALARVYKHHTTSKGKGVINMSFRVPFSQAMNTAVTLAAGPRLMIAIAAGNENVDACFTSPQSATVGNPFLFSVAAHDRNGTAASFTNFGRCADLSAPGVEILSDNGLNQGTSMASPHVAGAIAVLMSEGKNVSVATLTRSRKRNIPSINKPALQIDC